MTPVDTESRTSTAQIVSNLKNRSDDAALAQKIGNNLRDLEQRYMDALSDPKAKGTEALGVEYNRAMRAYEAFQRLMQNGHEVMMRAIQALGRG